MTNRGNIGPGWVDREPDEVVPASKVPESADEFEKIASGWLNNNAKQFDLFDWESVKEKRWKQKAFNEAGVYLLSALEFQDDDQIPELKDLVIDRVNDERYGRLILRNPRNLNHFAYPVLYTSFVGELQSDIEQCFKRVARKGEFWSSVRLPHRLLEYCTILEILGTPCEHDREEIIKHTSLNHCPHILLSDKIEAYYLTHDVMYSNFNKLFYSNRHGKIGNNTPNLNTRYDIRTEIAGLILRYIAENNLDLVLELLLSGILKRQVSRQMARLVLSWALKEVDKVGYIHGPKDESPLPHSLEMMDDSRVQWQYDHDDDEEALWAENYHTNVAAGKAARVLSRDWKHLDERNMDHSLSERSFRRDVFRLGEMLQSLAKYDLARGARRMEALARSPITSELSDIFQVGVTFLQEQRNKNGEFGYWADEEILYTNNEHAQDSFRDQLVKPVTELCETALDAVDPRFT